MSGRIDKLVAVSVVSHGHGSMVEELMMKLLEFPEVGSILVTLNIPENIFLPNNPKVQVISNIHPKGFAANHNSAFSLCNCDYYCVLNPDIQFRSNPFPSLLRSMVQEKIGMVAPRVESPSGNHEDSWRQFPSLLLLFMKLFQATNGSYAADISRKAFTPDWVAGMFMLFKSKAYRKINGFDEAFFLYYEDVDICMRLKKSNYTILACPYVSVIHDARRDSRRKFKYFYWHLSSIIQYLIKHRRFI